MKPFVFSLALALFAQILMAQPDVGAPRKVVIEGKTLYEKSCEVVAVNFTSCIFCEDEKLEKNCKEYWCSGGSCTPKPLKPDNQEQNSIDFDDLSFKEAQPDLTISQVRVFTKSPLRISVVIKNVGNQAANLSNLTIESRLSNQSQSFGKSNLDKTLPIQNWSGGGTLAPNNTSTKVLDFGNISTKEFKFLNMELKSPFDANSSNNKSSVGL